MPRGCRPGPEKGIPKKREGTGLLEFEGGDVAWLYPSSTQEGALTPCRGATCRGSREREPPENLLRTSWPENLHVYLLGSLFPPLLFPTQPSLFPSAPTPSH